MKTLLSILVISIVSLTACKKNEPDIEKTVICGFETIKGTMININGSDYFFKNIGYKDIGDSINLYFGNKEDVPGGESTITSESLNFYKIPKKIGRTYIISGNYPHTVPAVRYEVWDDAPIDEALPRSNVENWIEITDMCEGGIIGKAKLTLIPQGSTTHYYGEVEKLDFSFTFALPLK